MVLCMLNRHLIDNCSESDMNAIGTPGRYVDRTAVVAMVNVLETTIHVLCQTSTCFTGAGVSAKSQLF